MNGDAMREPRMPGAQKLTETSSRGRSRAMLYNQARPHQGRWYYGKTPTQTFLDTLPIAKEKSIRAA